MSQAPESRRPPVPGGPYLVAGLARSGQAVAALLARRGEEVIGVDSGSPPGAAGLAGSGVEVNLDVDGVDAVARARCLVKSPGVPAQVPVVRAARERGLPVLGELELAWRLLSNRFCAVSGTNGKTTVTELLGHIWRMAGEPVAVAGNVGTPLSSLVGEVGAEATVVCECSSFQLEDTEAFAPDCGVLLNVAPDHLDRHGTVDDYVRAKLRLFANQGNDDVSVYNGSDPALRSVDLGGCGRRIAFCRTPGEVDDCQASIVGDTIELWGEALVRLDELALIGPHNAANAAAAAAAAGAMGLADDAIAAGLRSFGGVPHRLEPVDEIGGVLYVNDSKATNVAAAAAALRSFDGGVRAILGGSPKGEAFTELAPPVIERCVACYLIGDAAKALERDLAPAWDAGVERRRCSDLADAVSRAADEAAEGEVVLLAPACASFDAYRDFEQRGEHFRELVKGME
ncbi:MAG: UDP-N-acetylmuramoyl-L-alanine--D-glutamate ligase [Solirubrobacterales bacterium]